MDREVRPVRPGDVVMLRSGGGPKMTIATINGNGRAMCRFFRKGQDGRDYLDSHEIEAVALRLVFIDIDEDD
jgi:uncharacterized protein YodC (DUF2158 family)